MKHSFSRFINTAGEPLCIDDEEDDGTEANVGEIIKMLQKREGDNIKQFEKESKKKKESDSEVRVSNSMPSIRIRTTPAQLATVMTSLTPAQKECIKGMGFGSMIGFNIDKLPGKLVYHVVDNFDGTEMVIKNRAGDIQIDRDSVHDVFGIPKGHIDISSLEFKADFEFISEWFNQFPNRKDIRPSAICTQILNSNGATDKLFKMNFLMLFANTMASSESNGKVKFDVLNYLSKDVDIASLDWCGFVLKNLKYSKSQWHRNDVNKNFYAGPATFLTVSVYVFIFWFNKSCFL